jgi:hypothetical protein
MTRALLQQSRVALIATLPYIGAGYKTAHTRSLVQGAIRDIDDELAKPEQADPLQTVRAAFRSAGLADGGVESLDDVGPELLWQIAEIRAKHTHTEDEVQKLIYCARAPRLNLAGFEDAVRDVLGVPAP